MVIDTCIDILMITATVVCVLGATRLIFTFIWEGLCCLSHH